MHVLMLSQNIVGQGGTFARCYALARALTGRGHRVTLLAASQRRQLAPSRETRDGVRIVHVPGVAARRVRHAGLDVLDVASRLRYVAPGGYDLIHAFDHRPSVSLPARYCRSRHHVPIVSDWCDLWGAQGLASLRRGLERPVLTALDTAWEKRFHGTADGLTLVSRALMRHAQETGIAAKRLLLLPPGASVEAITPLPQAGMRRKLGLPPGVPLLVHSGFSPLGARLLGHTFARLCHLDAQVRLLLAGGRFPELDRILRETQVEERVMRVGAVSYEQLGEVLACGDVMLLPYPDNAANRAGFPNKLGDYLAAGRAVVTNPTGDAGALVASEGVGLLADANPEAMAAAIKRLLDDAALRSEYGRRARDFAESQMAWGLRASQLEEFYVSVHSAFHASTGREG